MASDNIDKMLNEVGNVLARDTAYPLDGTFYTPKSNCRWSICRSSRIWGDHLLFRLPMRELSTVLHDLWEAEVPAKRWAAMQYRIDDGKFDASFTYGRFDPKERAMDRRSRILQQRYGNKRIEYPSIR